MKYEILAGTRIDEAAKEMVTLADLHREAVTADFNEVVLTAWPGDDPSKITNYFYSESQRQHEAYIQSDEYKQQQRLSKEREDKHSSDLALALKGAPAVLTLKDAVAWKSWTDANQDAYGGAVMSYASRWGRLMEAYMKSGETLAQCADRASHLADTEGITGFMYGVVVSMLSVAWIHGEELRCWHNLKTQIGNEGEKANESGGVLNPALLRMNVD